MRRGPLGITGALVLAILAVSLWMLQRNRASDETVGGAGTPRPVAPELVAPTLPVVDDAGSPSNLVRGTPALEAPPTEDAAAPAVSTLRVTVVTEAYAPIADARVVVKSDWRNVLVTDDDGVASVTAPPESEIDISARHPDFRFNLLHAAMPAAGAPPGEATIMLSKELLACVRIEDERGHAIEGAEVGFREIRSDNMGIGLMVFTPDEMAARRSNDTFEGVFHETRISGPDGRSCVQGITSGKAYVTAQADGYVTVSYRPVDVGPRGGDLGVVQLAEARRLAGTVVDANGPVPGALVESDFSGRNIGGYVRTTTDADGRFQFTTVPPSHTKVPLRVSHETRGDFYEDRFVVTDAPVTIVLRPSLDVTLHLRDAATKTPVPGPCKIASLMQRAGLLFRWQQPKSMASDNGEIHVGWVPYYATRVQLEAPGYARALVEAAQMQAANGAPIPVDLVRSGTIAIRAIDSSTGLPVIGAKVCVHYEGPSPNGPIDKNFASSTVQVDAPFDEAAGAYILDTSAFLFTPDSNESLAVSGPDGKVSEMVPVSANGVRVCGDVVQVTLLPARVTARPK